jgi:hypothetical protein
LTEVVPEQRGQLLAVGCLSGFLCQVFQDQAGVVGAAEKRPVDAPCDPRLDTRSAPNQQDAEPHTHGHGDFRLRLKEAGKGKREKQGRSYAQQENKNREPALHQQVTAAPL